MFGSYFWKLFLKIVFETKKISWLFGYWFWKQLFVLRNKENRGNKKNTFGFLYFFVMKKLRSHKKQILKEERTIFKKIKKRCFLSFVLVWLVAHREAVRFLFFFFVFSGSMHTTCMLCRFLLLFIYQKMFFEFSKRTIFKSRN